MGFAALNPSYDLRSITFSVYSVVKTSDRSNPRGAEGVEADALAQIAVGQLLRVGDMGAGRDDAEDALGNRLEIGAEVYGRFERQDRDPRRLDPDMAKHLLVGGLDPLGREHHRDAARLVGDERHRADIEPGAAIHWAGAG